MSFEEKYEDVLQNLEAAVMRIYRADPKLTDYDVMDAFEALRRDYIREARKQEPVTFNLPERAQEVFDAVHAMCELRLGRLQLTTGDGEALALEGLALTVNEIIDCIKRLERSVQRWNKSGGRQGYLNFVAEFIPAGAEDQLFLNLSNERTKR